jgi:hypothetical protein
MYITVAVAKVKSSTTIPGPSGYDQIDGEKRFDVTITKMYTVRIVVELFTLATATVMYIYVQD